MKWNLRLAAANRGIWKASELQRMLAARGMVISAGKMSGLWSGSPNTIRLDELDVICAVLGCGVEELLIPEPDKVNSGKLCTGCLGDLLHCLRLFGAEDKASALDGMTDV